nr:hypothetical protein [uncultured Shimia sp.]
MAQKLITSVVCQFIRIMCSITGKFNKVVAADMGIQRRRRVVVTMPTRTVL